MENINIENTNDTEKKEKMRRVLNDMFIRYTKEKELSNRIKSVFDEDFRLFNILLPRVQPSKIQTFVCIHRDLLVTCEQMKTVESNLTIVLNEITNLKFVIDSTDENPDDMFLRSKEKLNKMFEEMAVEVKESSDRLQVISAAIRSVE